MKILSESSLEFFQKNFFEIFGLISLKDRNL
jgi:hypothetical protein